MGTPALICVLFDETAFDELNQSVNRELFIGTVGDDSDA
jgi:hypothetical protein